MQFEMVPGLISVALCARNAESTVGEAVLSILNQDYAHFELFVIDDASEDQTFRAACSVSRDPRLRVMRLSRQIGTDAGKNFVLKHSARGEYFAHQDADDISWPARFSQQLAFLAENDVVTCGTGIDEFFTESDAYRVHHKDIPSSFFVKPGVDGYLHRKNVYPPFIGPDPDYNSYIIAMNGSLVFKADVLRAFGGADGRSLVAAGDTELLLRLIKFHRIGNLQEVLYSRRIHSDSVTASADRGRESAARIAYRRLIDAKHAYIRELIHSGRVEQARKECVEDMYHPEVEIEREGP